MLQQVALAVGLIVLGTHVCSSTFVDIDKNMPPFTVCVEFAVFQFNEQQEDEFAYKFLRVRRSQRQVSTSVQSAPLNKTASSFSDLPCVPIRGLPRWDSTDLTLRDPGPTEFLPRGEGTTQDVRWLMPLRRRCGQKLTWIYLMDVEMGRTICKKHDEDIDNCPLQEGEGEKMVRCTFIVDAKPWNFQYTILKSNCTKN
ncbi:cystatin-12 isoform X1 [Tupaia chinensis]|uniref:cystatin-12 isoform X1 n=1 Tax=Tupaia chinensis TaxID=246437 RepID=UPI0003C8D3AC|nr:cystatin-12 isoform X1 [Tupaia chinensis]